MKLLSVTAAGRATYGAVVGDTGMVDLGRRFGNRYPTLGAAIAGGAIAELQATVAGLGTDHPWADIEFDVPIPQARVLCIGRNYKGHVVEAGLTGCHRYLPWLSVGG